MTFYSRQQQEQEAKEKREKQAREDAASDYGYGHNNGDLTHHTWGNNNNKKKQSDPRRWIRRAEEQAQEEKDLAATQEALRLRALEYGYEYKDRHYVPLQDSASASAHVHQRTHRTRKPMKPLPSSTYMVCTQAALNTSVLAPFPNFVEKLQLLETQVGTLQQQIQDIDAMRNGIKHMGYKLTSFEQVLQFQHNQMQPRKTFRMRRVGELKDEDSEGLRAYREALEHAKQNNYEILAPI